MHTNNVVKGICSPPLPPLISIRQAHLIKHRLETVFDLLAAGTRDFGYVGFWLLDAVGCLLYGRWLCILGKSGQPLPFPKVRLGNVIVKAC